MSILGRIDELVFWASLVFICAVSVMVVATCSSLHLQVIRGFFRDSETGQFKLARILIVGLFSQLSLNPIFGSAIVSWFTHIDDRMRVAATIIMCSSSGLGSNFLSYFTYGNLEASLTLTALTTAFSLITFPLMVAFNTRVILGFDNRRTQLPLVNLFMSVTYLIFAGSMGIGIQLKGSKKLLRCLKSSIVLSGALMSLSSVVVLGADVELMESLKAFSSPSLYSLAVLLNFIGLAAGYLAGLLSGLPEKDRRTLTFEVGAQNTSLPFGVITLSFPHGERKVYLTMVLAYALTQHAMNAILALTWGLLFPVTEAGDKSTSSSVGPSLEGQPSPGTETSPPRAETVKRNAMEEDAIVV